MTRQHNSKETRELIINSAIQNFIEKGYSKTTLEDITKRVGLTRGAFYWNFECKKDILDEIVNRYERFYLDIYDRYEVLESARETIRNLLIKDITKKSNPSPYMIIIRYKVEISTEITDVVDRQRKLDDLFIGIIEREIRRGIESGEFRQGLDAHEATIFIFTYLLGFDSYMVVHYTTEADANLTKENIECKVDLILRSLS
ncbi:MAG: TetR/AcrR family transcriptional regulator [Clostridium sp.]|nr:TetR/AcrR family transcriptional regulator [Clostridium sp.]